MLACINLHAEYTLSCTINFTFHTTIYRHLFDSYSYKNTIIQEPFIITFLAINRLSALQEKRDFMNSLINNLLAVNMNVGMEECYWKRYHQYTQQTGAKISVSQQYTLTPLYTHTTLYHALTSIKYIITILNQLLRSLL